MALNLRQSVKSVIMFLDSATCPRLTGADLSFISS